jgi:hypothetical protein
MTTEERPRTLELDDRPLVRDVIVICKQIVRENRLHNRIIRAIGRLIYMDWAAWRFRQRMKLAQMRSESSVAVTKIVQREVDRVAAVVERLNQEVPREQHVRGKVYFPRGLFVVNRSQLNVPDSIDLVWPRGPKR